MKATLGALALACLCSSGCATKPANFVQGPTVEVFPIAKDEAWRRVTDFMIAHDLPMRSIKPSTGLIYAESATGARTTTEQELGKFHAFARCDSTAAAGGYVTGVLVYVRAIASASSSVTVTAAFYEVSKVGMGGQFATTDVIVHCRSTGRLEAGLMSVIAGS